MSGRLLRASTPDVIRMLPEQRRLRIDVNGVFAGSILAVPDCPRELAVGWAFMHGFFEVDDVPDCVTVDGDRISVMVASGEDIDRRRLEAVGWAEAQPMDRRDTNRDEPFVLDAADLLDILDAAWHAFRHDGSGEGYVHAATASTDQVDCVARDTGIHMAAAKVFGWMVLDSQVLPPPVLILNGQVDRQVVDVAAGLGMEVIATSGMPTADAFRAATGHGLSMVGMATSRAARLLVDAGHVTLSDEISRPA